MHCRGEPTAPPFENRFHESASIYRNEILYKKGVSRNSREGENNQSADVEPNGKLENIPKSETDDSKLDFPTGSIVHSSHAIDSTIEHLILMCVQLSSSIYDGKSGGDGTYGVDKLKGQEPFRFLTSPEGTASELYQDDGSRVGEIIGTGIVRNVIGNAFYGFSVPGFLAFRFFLIGKIASLALAGMSTYEPCHG